MQMTQTIPKAKRRSKKFCWIAMLTAALCIQLGTAKATFGQTTDPGDGASLQLPLSNNQSDAVRNKGLNNSIGQQSKPAFDPGRVKSINDRIQLLSSLIEAEKKAAGAAGNTSNDPAPTKPNTNLDTKPIDDASTPADATPSQEQGSSADNTAQSNSMKPKITLVGAKISEPVNTLELGYSLYRTRNYQAAEKNFAQLLSLKPDPSEAAWLHCMIGCCQSLQNRLAESDVSFRKCTNQRQAPPFAAKYADWKLRYLSERGKAKQTFKDIQTEFQSITTGN